MVFLVLEAHGALHFCSGIDESTQGVAGKRVVVSACVYVFEFSGLVIAALGIRALEQEPFDLVGGVVGGVLFLVQSLGVALQHATNVGGVGSAALVDDFAEDQHFAGAEHVGGRPVECGPVDAQAQIALALGREATNG